MNSVEEYARRSKHEKKILKLIETGLKVQSGIEQWKRGKKIFYPSSFSG